MELKNLFVKWADNKKLNPTDKNSTDHPERVKIATMPKHSYEDNYPWHDSNRWGVTASVETMKWVIKTWDEGLLESESDYKNLVDFNSTLESLHNKLKTQTNGTNVQQEVSPWGAAATPIGGVKTPAAGDRHRLPLDQYDTLK